MRILCFESLYFSCGFNETNHHQEGHGFESTLLRPSNCIFTVVVVIAVMIELRLANNSNSMLRTFPERTVDRKWRLSVILQIVEGDWHKKDVLKM